MLQVVTAVSLLAGEENGIGRNTWSIGAGLGGCGVYFSVQTELSIKFTRLLAWVRACHRGVCVV